MSQKNFMGLTLTFQYIPDDQDDLDWILRMLHGHADDFVISTEDQSGFETIMQHAELVTTELTSPMSGFMGRQTR